jgi:hypothetical protein
VTPTDGSVTTGKIVDDAVTAAKVASSGAFAIGAAGTASSLAGIPFFQGDTGSIYTHDVSGTDSTAQYNTAYGLTALDAITTGDRNTAIGYGAGGALTVATDCVFVGRQAGVATTEGTNSTFVGSDAGAAVTTGLRNTMIGAAGWQFDAENDNLGIGHNALAGVIAGGEYNVAIGNYALDALTSGDNNIAIGYEAGTDMTTAGQNVLVGSYAGPNLTTGATQRNIMMGYAAGFYMTDETNNIGIGALACGGTGTPNGGEFNTCVGSRAIEDLTTGDHNTAIGYIAGANVNTGYQNTIIGSQAGDVLTSGDDNVIIGYNAAAGHTGGDQQTVVGSGCAASGTGHQIVMGYNNAAAGNGYVTLGQGSGGDKIYALYTSNATWTKASDERIKKDITTNTDCGLDFINELRTVKFKKRNHSEVDASLAIYDASDTEPRDDIIYGLIAQEVKAAMEKHNVNDFDGWHKLSKEASPDEIQGVSEQMFVYPLIKAVQELSAKVKALEEA